MHHKDFIVEILSVISRFAPFGQSSCVILILDIEKDLSIHLNKTRGMACALIMCWKRFFGADDCAISRHY